MMTTDTATEFKPAEQRAQELHDRIEATYSPEIFRMAYDYAEAMRESEDELKDREWTRFLHRLAAHFPGIAPAIICVAEAMSELDMGHATPRTYGTEAHPHFMGVEGE